MHSRLDALRRWARSLDPVHVDWVVAALLLAGFEASIWTGTGHHHRGVAAAFAVIPNLAVAVRRRWLIEVLAVALVAVSMKVAIWGTGVAGQGGGVGLVAVALLFYATDAFYSGRRSLLAFCLGLTVVAISQLGTTTPVVVSLSLLLGVVAVPPWLLGRMARDHAERERAARGAPRDWTPSASCTFARPRSASAPGSRGRSTT